MDITTVIGIVVVVLLVWMVSIYNLLIGMIQTVKNNNKQIDIQLDRRAKVFYSLIEVVKKAMSHEIEVLTKVTKLRESSVLAHENGDVVAHIAAENEISKLIPQLAVQMEAYPQITANTNALQLQEEIVSTENKLSFAKQAYNDSIERYEAKKQSFVESFVVAIFSKLDEKFSYWGIAEDTRMSHESATVKF